jgi:hypothetical protein
VLVTGYACESLNPEHEILAEVERGVGLCVVQPPALERDDLGLSSDTSSCASFTSPRATVPARLVSPSTTPCECLSEIDPAIEPTHDR